MKTISTKGIVLKKIKFEEADVILTIITPDHGKVRLIAKSARKSTSKLAGGIELFCESNFSFVEGKRDIGTLISSRLFKYHQVIFEDLQRMNCGYQILLITDKATQDQFDKNYYELLANTMDYLGNKKVDWLVALNWFMMQLMVLSGHSPNLKTYKNGNKLESALMFNFETNTMTFIKHTGGNFSENHIKLLRLYAQSTPDEISAIKSTNQYNQDCQNLLKSMIDKYVNV